MTLTTETPNSLQAQIGNEFFNNKQAMQAQSDGWKIKGLEARVEYLEFALTKVIAMLADLTTPAHSG